jgi:cytochrome P450
MFGDHARLKLQALVEAQRENVGATLICRPRDEYLTAVGADGVLVTQSPGGFETRVRLSPMSGEAPCAIEQFMDDPRVPIVSTVLDYRDVMLELNAVGHVDSDSRRLDVVRWRLSSRPEVPARREALRVEIVGGDGLDLASDRQLHVVGIADAGGHRGEHRRVVHTEPFDFGAPCSVSGALAFLVSGPPVDSPLLEVDWVDGVLRTERRLWVGGSLDSSRFRVPDRSVMDLVLACDRVTRQRGEESTDTGAENSFLRAVRHLVVSDAADHVDVLSGVPLDWLREGAELVVGDAPTRFGPVSVHAVVASDKTLTITIEACWAVRPRHVIVWPPPDTISVTVDGMNLDDATAGILIDPADVTTVVCRRPPTPQAVDGHLATKAALRDWSVYSSACAFKPDIRSYPQLPLESDRPDHSGFRSILEPWFRRSRLAELEPQFRVAAADVISRFAAAGRADAVIDLALPMVVRSLAVTLGRPQDVAETLSWGVAINVVHGFRDGRQTDAYIARVLDEVSSDPATDVFRHIATASLPDRQLTRTERIGLASMVLTAGRAAAANLLAGAMWILATRPDERAWLAADRTRISPAIEEMLRYLSPAPEMTRLVASDVDRCPVGSEVTLSFVSANYDETAFPEPDVIDLARSPNPHIAFGTGPHICLGANLARIEAKVFLEELLDASVDFELDGRVAMSWHRVGDRIAPRDFESVPLVITT